MFIFVCEHTVYIIIQFYITFFIILILFITFKYDIYFFETDTDWEESHEILSGLEERSKNNFDEEVRC